MPDDFDFYLIEDEVASYLKVGMSISEISDNFGYDADVFSTFIENDEYAKILVRKAMFQYKLLLKKGLNIAIAKGMSKAIEGISCERDNLRIEFIRGDMRKPDEIHISNMETHAKKSLASRLL